jgi:hypothetical protein
VPWTQRARARARSARVLKLILEAMAQFYCKKYWRRPEILETGGRKPVNSCEASGVARGIYSCVNDYCRLVEYSKLGN